jgi:signal transduction histidine kinase
MHSAEGRSTIRLMTAAGIVLVAVILTSVKLVEDTRSVAQEFFRLNSLRTAINRALNLIKDAETAQRGYLLTEQTMYLQPYNRAIEAERPDFHEITRFGDGEIISSGDIERLDRLRREKLSELAMTIDLTKAGRREDALKIVFEGDGQARMDEMRNVVGKIVGAVDRKMSMKFEQLQDRASLFRWVNVGGALLITAFAAGAIMLINRYVREVIATRKQIASLNRSLEHRVEERTMELARANEEIQRFASVVTHDLRAPLVNVMGFTSELARSLELATTTLQCGQDKVALDSAIVAMNKDMTESIDFIRSSTVKMDGLINAILKLSRDGQRQIIPEWIDMAPLLQGVISSLHRQIEQADAIVIVEPSLGSIYSDRFSIEQVFTNIIDNAIKYLEPARRGSIRIRGYKDRDESSVIEVIDNGRGIPPQDHERIFEMFRRAGTRDRPGEGIGLAHVRMTLRRLGGDVDVRSELGQGATFRVKIPNKSGDS